MKLLSAGEMQPNMLVMGYEEVEEVIPNIMASIESEFDLIDIPRRETKRINLKPWYKGYPWRVLEVAGPVIMVDSLGATVGKTKLAPSIIFDSRYTHFIEVTEDYYLNFWKHMGIPIELPAKAQKIEVEVITPETDQVPIVVKKMQANFDYKKNFGSGNFELS